MAEEETYNSAVPVAPPHSGNCRCPGPHDAEIATNSEDDEPENGPAGIVSGVDTTAIIQIFATHLELSLQHSHPEKAAKAAYAAVDGYLQSYSFIDTSHKGSSGISWRQVVKRERGGDAMR